MARELNRDLFKEMRESMNREAPEVATPVFAKADEVRILHMHLEHLSKRVKEYESRIETMQTRFDELTTQNKQRFERVQGHFQRQGEMQQNATTEIHNKFAQLASRINERKVSETAVKEMVERQAALVQSFEVRLQQLTRVINEQEMALMGARAELKDALQELSRLKKL